MAQVLGGPPRIRNVYIPSDQLKVLFGNSSQGVLMPREKILALWQEARTNEQARMELPADTILTQANYRARLDAHELRITGRIQFETLRAGWQAVDLPFGGLAFESARLGEQPAQFGRRDDGTLFLLHREQGRFALDLEMSAPLASKDGDLAVTLKLPPVLASEFVLELDANKQLQIGETTILPDSVDNGLAADPRGGGPDRLLPLLISDRSAGGNRAPLVFATSRSTATVEPAGLRWQVTLDLDVYARGIDSLRLELPASVDVAEIAAAGDGAMDDPGAGRRHGERDPAFPQTVSWPPYGSAARAGPAPLAQEWKLPTLACPAGRVARRPGAGARLAVAANRGRRIGLDPAGACRADGRRCRQRAVGVRVLG